MFIFNVLPLREFRSPKSQFAMVNVCVLSMYYHVLLFQISDNRQRTPGNWSESSRICSIRPHTLRMMQNSHQLLTYLHYVSEACPGREPYRIPANYTNSTQFAHTVRESREIRTIYLHYPLRFRCLTSGREHSEITANQAKFTRFAPISRELREFRALRTKINTCNWLSDLWPSTENPGRLERINKIPLNSPTYYANYANSAHFTVN